ncbi:hypothetical protein BD410DRAFT_847112 [Rickenella mellea]|uniref:Uncharacterized protein n=1 Tax=Rickenella mellea TaxID=50990 RepID=A0A4Y7PDD9_9AGAM|nr:hypothetical protein BD410DRAFT_847112 [Rickenella mellea]
MSEGVIAQVFGEFRLGLNIEAFNEPSSRPQSIEDGGGDADILEPYAALMAIEDN